MSTRDGSGTGRMRDGLLSLRQFPNSVPCVANRSKAPQAHSVSPHPYRKRPLATIGKSPSSQGCKPSLSGRMRLDLSSISCARVYFVAELRCISGTLVWGSVFGDSSWHNTRSQLSPFRLYLHPLHSQFFDSKSCNPQFIDLASVQLGSTESKLAD
jgi:hypothetical protein